jgi:HAD superfamily hydrolase (TIGR01484 family)
MKISLLLADVDGTLVTREKLLTERASKAVLALREHGIKFAITSGRPPRGMSMLFDPLDLDTPIAGFNGGMIVKRDLSIIEARTLPRDVAQEAIDLILKHGMDAWVYAGNDWYVRDPKAPHVDREAWTVKFPPTVVKDFGDRIDQAVKIVGVSDRTLATLLSRHHPSRCQQGGSGGVSVQGSRDTARADRDDRRPAKRRADVPPLRPQHRDGQRL